MRTADGVLIADGQEVFCIGKLVYANGAEATTPGVFRLEARVVLFFQGYPVSVSLDTCYSTLEAAGAAKEE